MKKTSGGIIILNISTINKNHMMYDSWDMEHNRQNFFSFWTFFALLHPPPPTPLQPRESKFWKNEKSIWIYNLLHKCTINNNNMIYRSWDMKCTIHIFLSSWAIFSFYPPNSLKNKNFKKMEKRPGVSSFYTSVPKIMIICYTVPDIWRVTGVIVIFHFGPFFALLPS